MPKVQKALSRHEGLLSKLSGAADLEPGKLGESGLPASDHIAALRDDLVLAFRAFGRVLSVVSG